MMRFFLLGACLLSAAAAQAQILKLRRSAGRLHVSLENIDYPATFQKDLGSGLTSRILARISVLEESDSSSNRRLLAEQVVIVEAKFDLWEERIEAQLIREGGEHSLTFANAAQAGEALRSLRFEALPLPAGVTPKSQLVVTGQVMLNPIQKDRIEKIRKWVAEKVATARASGTTSNHGQSLVPRSDLLIQVFDQYTKGQDVIGTWKADITSSPFTLGDLAHE